MESIKCFLKNLWSFCVILPLALVVATISLPMVFVYRMTQCDTTMDEVWTNYVDWLAIKLSRWIP